MTPDQIRAALPILQAFADGKTVQCQSDLNTSWFDCSDLAFGPLLRNPDHYRIKPEPRELWVAVDRDTYMNPIIFDTPVTVSGHREVIHVREVLE